jgi:2,4-dienoyl-CoA reductase-like NADH-dependent reductase (Old Yellow Enzyme family)
VTSPLFEPLWIGTLDVSGRVFESATEQTRCLPDGHTGEAMIEFYEPLAGAGTR